MPCKCIIAAAGLAEAGEFFGLLLLAAFFYCWLAVWRFLGVSGH
jgi:hypothetical protein